MNSPERLTTEDFWDRHWDAGGQVGQGFTGYDARVWRAIFQEAFAGAKPGDSCLEVGCADSRYLPWIATEFGLAVAGLDYTENGCRLARERLAQAGVAGEVYHRDVFAPNADLAGKFDFVVSFGLVEHFEDTTTVLKAMRPLLKPGGRILTTTPNVTPHSFNVLIHRLIAPKILAMHRLMTADELRSFHEQSGYRTIAHGYIGMGLCLACDRPTWWRRALRAGSYRALQAVRRGLELLHIEPPRTSMTGLFMVYLGEV